MKFCGKEIKFNMFSIYPILPVVILFISVLLFITSGVWIKEGYFHDAILQLATEVFILAVASFFLQPYLDAYHEKQKENKWSLVKVDARKETIDVIKNIFFFVLLPFYGDTKIMEKTIREVVKNVTKFEEEKVDDLMPRLKRFEVEFLKDNITQMQSQLEMTVLFYKDILPQKLLRDFLEARRNITQLLFNCNQYLTFNKLKDEQEEIKSRATATSIYNLSQRLIVMDLKVLSNTLKGVLAEINKKHN